MKVPRTGLPKFAQGVLSELPARHDRAALVVLSGELGSGKTTFVQALAKELGVEQTVASPTYVLMKKYRTTHPVFKTLVHVDAYRLDKPREFAALKPAQFLNDPGNLVVVEWPERLGGALPPADATVRFSADGAKEGERYIEVV